MPIKLNGATSGSVELGVPDAVTGGDVTLTLPPNDGSAGQFLNTNGSGALSFATIAPFSEVDNWRLTADKQGSDTDVTANFERVDAATSAYIGSGMSVSSGIWTFPQTGIYFILYTASFVHDGNDNSGLQLLSTTNGGNTFDILCQAIDGNTAGEDRTGSATAFAIVDVTDTSNVKVKFKCDSFAATSRLLGNSNQSETHFLFVRIGDT
jgi:hypothetical protein